ncbi:MAG: phosphatidylglycerophosphatase A [Candidatus Omnitrophica bacterium]|nr:phosphatidylglycerophosphatase A [Candidatus Omnitrophota bacterium]
MSDKLAKLISTFFYVGYFPVAPGTMGSAVAVALCFILHKNPILYILCFAIITYLGFRAGGRMEKLVGKKDPGCVVIDEVSGVMIAFIGLPYTPAVVWTAFFLFRAFDMFKVYPANKFEKMGGGTGIMMDDIMAGIYTCLFMHIAIRLAGIL